MGAAVRSRIPSFYQEMSEVCVVIFMFMSDQQIRDVLIRKTELCQFQTGSVAAVYQEILILVTELAADPLTARFISAYGCPEYHKYDKELMFYERRIELINEIEKVSDSEVPPEKQGTTGNN